jgi:hypothetical protein
MKNDIKTELKEIEFEIVDCIQLAQDKVQQRAVMNKVITFGFRKSRGKS